MRQPRCQRNRRHRTRTQETGRGGMEKHSILVKQLKFIKPIRCDNCGGNARLVRRSPHRIKGSEVQVFECDKCGCQINKVVEGDANLLPPVQ
jgi:hypothetical protein